MISIIVPIYNVEDLIERCICSVLNQYYTNFELILIDDGSTDNSLNICKMYEKNDARIKVLSEANKGVAEARNYGIENSRGEFIMFLDADDWIERDYVENIMLCILKSPTCDFWITDYTIEENGECKRKSSFAKEFELVNPEDITALKRTCLIPQYGFSKNFKSVSFLAGILGKIYKSSIIRENHIRVAKELKVCEDVMFNIKYLENCQKVEYFHEYGYYYVMRATSKMHDFKKSLLEDYITYIERLNLEIAQKKLENIDIKIVNAVAVRMLYTFFSGGFFLKIYSGDVYAAEVYVRTIIEQRLSQYIYAGHIPYLEFRHKMMLLFIKCSKTDKLLQIMKVKRRFFNKDR